jgi:hypothetical protein
MRDFLINEGFVKLDMPHANIIENISWNNVDGFLQGLSAKNRAHIRTDVLKYEKYYDVEVKSVLSQEEKEQFYDLYLQIKARNFAINYFPYPEKLIESFDKFPGWEFIILRLKPEYDSRPGRPAVSMGACYKTPTHYSPMLLGMDYAYVYDYKVYKHSLYHVVKRAAELGLPTVYFGFSADTDKRKFGAKQVHRSAFLQAKDNFSFEVIESMAVLDTKHIGENL